MAEFLQSYGIWIVWIIFGLFFLFFLVTAPCHAVLLLPVLALPIFWLLPLGYALPVYAVILLISVLLYWLIRRVMRRPLSYDGFHSLVGTEAEVVSKPETGRSATRYLVRVQGEGELWSAHCKDALEIGEQVNIVAVKGIGVVVERANAGSETGGTGGTKTTAPGNKCNRRDCH